MDMKIQTLQDANGGSSASSEEAADAQAVSSKREEVPVDTPEEARVLIEKLQTQADGMRITMRAMEKQLAQAQERAEHGSAKKGFLRRLFGR